MLLSIIRYIKGYLRIKITAEKVQSAKKMGAFFKFMPPSSYLFMGADSAYA